MKHLLYILTFILLLSTIACESNLENDGLLIEESSSNFNGDWIVKANMDNNITFGPFDIKIQTTPKKDSLYIKDNGDFWNFQVKTATNSSNNSFKSELSVNELSKVSSKIKVLNGKVIENDSIYFEIQFEDDETPYGITYYLKGHRK